MATEEKKERKINTEINPEAKNQPIIFEPTDSFLNFLQMNISQTCSKDNSSLGADLFNLFNLLKIEFHFIIFVMLFSDNSPAYVLSGLNSKDP